MESVEFYFDFSCPWSYLAFVRLRETSKRMGAGIRWRPVRTDDILRQANPAHPAGREPREPRKSAYEALDIEAWADYIGVQINRPADWPVDPTLAASGLLLAARQGLAHEYCDAVFSAYFGLGRDISDQAVVLELAELAGLERGAAEAALTDPSVTQQLAANEAELLERGGFGTPTMFVGAQMFFGSDRMPLVEFALGQTSDLTFVMPGEHRG